jgi:diguanylate cyclase (GGDEF)-like protein
MSVREDLAAVLVPQLDFILFFYGLAFILLGTVCLGVSRMREQRSIWLWLGLFGLLHGAGEWLDLIALIVADHVGFALFRTALLATSFLMLMEFARRKSARFGGRPVSVMLYTALILPVTAGGIVGGADVAAAITRYAIAFPAAIATAAVFVAHAGKSHASKRGLSLIVAAEFVLYGIAAGLIVPSAPFWPANIFNGPWFLHTTGIPIQLLRGTLACLLAVSVWMIWGHLTAAEMASNRYTAHLRRHFGWSIAAMTAIMVLGWMLTQFLGDVQKREVETTTEGYINLITGRFESETSLVDGMVRTLADSPLLLPLFDDGSAEQQQRARAVLGLHVESADALIGGILDRSGALIASTGPASPRQLVQWLAAPWYSHAFAGQAGSFLSFDPTNGERNYVASRPVRREDGTIVGVAFIQRSLAQLDADLRQFAQLYFLVGAEGVVVQTNRPQDMRRSMWPLTPTTRSTAIERFGAVDDRPILAAEVANSAWVKLDGERSFVRRSFLSDSQWSVILAIPVARIHASRILGIVITLLVTTMAQIYLFGREHNIRDRVQLHKRLELQELAQTLRFQATTDPLTGLSNRARFNEALAHEIARARRYGSPMAVILFDIDRFKEVNDIYGHPAGDDVLMRVSAIVSESVRETDLVARWGGEEFVVLAPGLDREEAYNLAEKLRRTIETAVFDILGGITCSFGVAQLGGDDSPQSLIASADGALYRAKANGRNRTELSPDPRTPEANAVSAA